MRKILFSLLTLLTFACKAQYTNRDGYTIWQGRMSIGKQTINSQAPWSYSWLEVGDSGTSKTMILPRVTSTSVVPAKVGYFHLDLSDGFLHYRNATGDHVIADTSIVNIALGGKTISGAYTNGGITFTRADGTTFMVSGLPTDSNNVSGISFSNDTLFLARGSLPSLTTVIPLSSKLSAADTAGRWITKVLKSGDSVFYYVGGVKTFAYKDSVGTAGTNSYTSSVTYANDVLSTFRNGMSTITTTLPFSSKLNIGDTASMLGNYVNSNGYGIIKTGKSVSVDTSALVTKLYLSWLPSFNLTSTDINNWNTAYQKRPISFGVTGSSVKTIQLMLADGTQLSGSFTDMVGGSNGTTTTINSDTSTTQSLLTGTDGKDFNIADAYPGLHTFNIPFASYTTNGKLDSLNFQHFDSAYNTIKNSSAAFIQNQNASAQTANAWISGKISADNGFRISGTASNPGYAFKGSDGSYFDGMFYQNDDIINFHTLNQINISIGGNALMGFTLNGTNVYRPLTLVAGTNAYASGGYDVLVRNQGTGNIEKTGLTNLVGDNYIKNQYASKQTANAWFDTLKLNRLIADTVNGLTIGTGGGSFRYNIAVGIDALLNNNAGGTYNTAIGWGSQKASTIGGWNTSVGILSLNTLDSSIDNTAIGANAMRQNITGQENTAIGSSAFRYGTKGRTNTVIGYNSGSALRDGSYNTIIGANNAASASISNTVSISDGSGDVRIYSPASKNVLIGTITDNGVDKFQVNGTASVLAPVLSDSSTKVPTTAWVKQNVSSNSNNYIQNQNVSKQTASAWINSLVADTIVSHLDWTNVIHRPLLPPSKYLNNGDYFSDGTSKASIWIGDSSALNIVYNTSGSNQSGASNTSLGMLTMRDITTGSLNTAIGATSLRAITTGNWNNAFGVSALRNLTTGNDNTAFGQLALASTNGSENVSIGNNSLQLNTTGGSNVAIGLGAGYKNLGSGNIFLGHQAGYNETGSNKLYVANSGTTTPLIYGEFDNKKIQFNGKGLFTDTLTATTMSLPDSSNRVATTMWVKQNLPTAGIQNPMTTAGDMIYGGAGGAPTRLAPPPTSNYVLGYTVGTASPTWLNGVAWNGTLVYTNFSSSTTGGISATATVYTGTSAGNWTIPTSSGNTNKNYFVKNAGTANLTLTRQGTDVINGSATSVTLTPGQSVWFLGSGSGSSWYTFFDGSGSAGTPSNLALGANDASSLAITNSNGTGVTLPTATATTAGLMPAGLYNQAYQNTYFQNKGTLDTLLTQIDDSTYGIKSIKVAPGSNITVTPTIDANSITYTIASTATGGGSFTDGGYAPFDATKKVLIKDTASNLYYHTNGAVMNLTSVANGDLLKYNNGQWVNFTPNYLTANQSISLTLSGDVSGSASGATTLSPSVTVNGLKGVTVPALASGYLHYNGSAFVWDTPSGGGSFTDAGYAVWDATKKVLIKDTVSGNYYHTSGAKMLTTNLANNDLLIDSAGYWVNRTPSQIKTLIGVGSSANSVYTTTGTGGFYAGAYKFVSLTTITGSNDMPVTLPGESGNTNPAPVSGDEYWFRNENTNSTYHYVFSSTAHVVKDITGATVTTLTNGITYHIVYDGTNWKIF